MASSGGGIQQLVGPDDREAGVSTAESATGSLTWHYTADGVRDFGFGTSDRYVWGATVANGGDRDGDAQTAVIHTLYRPSEEAWTRSAEFGQFSLDYLSEMLMPYSYPRITVVEGIIGGGME